MSEVDLGRENSPKVQARGWNEPTGESAEARLDALRQVSQARARAETALEDSERRLELALGAARMGVWEWDIATGVVAWSADLARLHCRGNEAMTCSVEEALEDVHPDDRDRLMAAIRASLDHDAAYHIEYRIVTPTGTELWVESKATILRAPDGSPRRMVGVCSDATPREEAAKTRALLAAIVDSSDDAIISKTLDGVITTWNAGAERTFGYTVQEAVGRSITMLIPEHLRDEEREILAKVRRGERIEHYETIRQAKCGRLLNISLSVSPVRDRSGAIVGVSKVARDVTAARRAETERQASESRYRQLIQSLPAAVYACDADGYITLYNDAAARLWGCAPEIGRTRWCGSVRAYDTDGRAVTGEDCGMAVTIRTGRPAPRREVVIERSDGSRRNVLPHPEPQFDGAGKVIGAVNMLIDLTPIREAERALSQSEERFRTLADNMSQLAWMTDDRGWIFWYNQRWFDYTGTTLDEMQGWGWMKVHHPDHVDRVVQVFRAAIESGTHWEDTFPIRSKDGEYRWFLSRAVPIRGGDGRILRWFGTNTDVTVWRETQEALRQSERRFRTMADSAPVLIWTSGEDGARTWVNRPWLEFTGRSAEEELGAGWTAGLHPDDLEATFGTYAAAFEARREFRTEHRLRRHDGAYRWMLDKGVPLFDTGGGFMGYIGSCLDITEEVLARRAMENQRTILEHAVHARTSELEESHRRLRVSERMAALGTLSAGLGHDMANILLPVRLHLDTAESLAAPDAILTSELRAIRASLEYLQNLSSGLRMLMLDPSERRAEASTEIGAWWRQASAVLRSAVPAGMVFRCRLPSEGVWVSLGATALTQVALNLIQNAIEALRPQKRGVIEVEIVAEGEAVCLRVRDDGPGMPPEVRERCFQPFFTTKGREMSSGLGLSLVYGIVQECGGTLEIESGPGRGTTVIVRLRAAPPPASPPAPEQLVLIAVSDPRLRAIIAAELRTLGFQFTQDPGLAALRIVDSLDDVERLGPTDEGVTLVLCEPDSTTGSKPGRITQIRQRVRAAAQQLIRSPEAAHAPDGSINGGDAAEPP